MDIVRSISSTYAGLRERETREALSGIVSGGATSILVLRGDEGSGKSSVLNSVIASLRSSGTPVVALAEAMGADSWSSASGRDSDAITVFIMDDADSLDEERISAVRERLRSNSALRVIVTTSGPSPFDRVGQVLPLDPISDQESLLWLSSEVPGAPATIVEQAVDFANGSFALLLSCANELRQRRMNAFGWLLPSFDLPIKYQWIAERFLAADAHDQSRLVLAALTDVSPFASVLLDLSEVGSTFMRKKSIDRVEFRSPVHRAAVLNQASDQQRFDAHAELASSQFVGSSKRAEHRARSIDDGGASLAQWADATAGIPSARRTLAHLTAARQAEEADAPKRLGRAISSAALSGDLVLANSLLRDPRADDTDSETMIGAALVSGLEHGDMRVAETLLRRAEEGAAGSGGRERAIVALAVLNVIWHDPKRWKQWLNMIRGDEPAMIKRLFDSVRSATGVSAVTDGLAQYVQANFSRGVDDLTSEVLANAVSSTTFALNRTDFSPPDVAWSNPLVRSISDLVNAMQAIHEGKFKHAARFVNTGLAVSSLGGMRLIALGGRAMRSLAQALIGDADSAGHEARTVLADPLSARFERARATARHALLDVALQRADWVTASQLINLNDAEDSADGAYNALWMMDVADVVANFDQSSEARAHLQALVRQSPHDVTIGERIARDYALIVLQDSDQEPAFERLLKARLTEGAPMEIARIHLAYARLLGQASTVSDAHYAQAVDLFDGLGAIGWSGRTRTEMGTVPTQQPMEPRVPEPPIGPSLTEVPLTAQELRIASLAARGMSNKDIGAMLYLSPRTVAGHLYSAFPKLGIASRAALRDALSQHIRDSSEVAS